MWSSAWDDEEWLLPFRNGRLEEAGEGDVLRLFRGSRRGRGTQISVLSRPEPAPRSSRPVMASGEADGRAWHATSFHFRHDFLSAGGGGGGGAGAAPTSGDRSRPAEFQRYIERLEESDIDAELPLREGVERDEAGPISFGDLGGVLSLGATAGDTRRRATIWDMVAKDVETRVNARWMCRVTCELPHELDAAERRHVAEGFAEILARHRLPFWAAVHLPDVGSGSDPRNYHLHVVYHGRRFQVVGAEMAEAGGHDGPVASSGTIGLMAERRKADEPRAGAAWIRELRTHFAEAVNNVLRERAARMAGQGGIQAPEVGSVRLYDPRSYAAAGVDKLPTEHLGARASALERLGVPTGSGARNRRREILHAVAEGRIDLGAQERVAASLGRLAAEGVAIAGASERVAVLTREDPLNLDGRFEWERRRRGAFDVGREDGVGVRRDAGWAEIEAALLEIERLVAVRRRKEAEEQRARRQREFAEALQRREQAMRLLEAALGGSLAGRLLSMWQGDDQGGALSGRENLRLGSAAGVVAAAKEAVLSEIERRERYRAVEERATRLAVMESARASVTVEGAVPGLIAGWASRDAALRAAIGLEERRPARWHDEGGAEL